MDNSAKYLYFQLNKRQLKLLKAAVLHSMHPLNGKALSKDDARQFASLYQALRVPRFGKRHIETIVIAENQWCLAGIAVGTTHLALTNDHPLKCEYANLIAALNSGRTSRRNALRDASTLTGSVSTLLNIGAPRKLQPDSSPHW